MRISSGTLGILQGSRMLFSDFADGGPMWTGEGDREVRQGVAFDPPFTATPAVIVGLSLLDLDRRTNARLDLVAENVTPAGFDIVLRTWGDSRIARIRADWTALGAVRGEDEWDVE
jgi:H-type lectin domain